LVGFQAASRRRAPVLDQPSGPGLHLRCLAPAAGGDAGAIGIISNGVVRFTRCAFYDNIVEWGSGGASERAQRGGGRARRGGRWALQLVPSGVHGSSAGGR
jgi:hypothetical protein